MNQLKMIWKRQDVLNYPPDSEYHIRAYRDSDEQGWIETCRNGLVGDDYTIDDFYENMLGDKYVDSENIFFILNDNDDIVATAAALKTDDTEKGTLHMVSVRKDYRGKGLSKPITEKVMQYFYDNEYKSVSLSTDDWRYAAVKVYLEFGFKPYLYEDGMVERWEKLLTILKIDYVSAYDNYEKLIDIKANSI